MRCRDDDPLSDDEYPDEADSSDDDVTQLVRCSECGEMIAEDSQQCPHCKTWCLAGVGESNGAMRRVAWAILVFVLIGVILVMWHGLRR